MEGSGSGAGFVSLTSISGSGRPKKLWNWIRNTDNKHELHALFETIFRDPETKPGKN
jgi:hypothetical protein